MPPNEIELGDVGIKLAFRGTGKYLLHSMLPHL
jgi:hypothetical protein